MKVDASALLARGKENATSPNIVNGAVEKNNAASKEEEEKARQQKELEAKQAELRRRDEERNAMQLFEKLEQQREQEEQERREAERRRLLLEEQHRREEELALQQKREQERKLEEEAKEKARKLQEDEDLKKIHAWLEANGFKEINGLVRKRLSKVAPLQCAIQQKNVEMMILLLQHGADPSNVNGKNESALTFAQKMDKKGSHTAIVQALKTYQK